eukprot:8007888-Heterocapsa_arctica.AAC.1
MSEDVGISGMRNPGKTFDHAPRRRTGAQQGGQLFGDFTYEGPSAAAVEKVRERIRDWLGTVEETLP